MTSAPVPVSRTQRRAWIALVVVCVIWGTTYLAIKVALETIPPFLMGGARYVIAGLILGVVLAARGRSLPPGRAWGHLAVLGFCMLGLGNGGVVWGEQFVPSGLTAVLIGTSPFWMVGVDATIFKGERLHAREWMGLIVGFSGIVILVWPDISLGGVTARRFAYGVLALQIACVGWAVGSSYARRHVLPSDILGSAAVQMVFGGLIMIAVGTAAGEWGRVALAPRTVAAFVYLILAGSVVAFAAYSYALQHLPVRIVSLYTYVNPVIAVALGTLILGEPFHLRMLVAAAIIVVGILVVGPARPVTMGKR